VQFNGEAKKVKAEVEALQNEQEKVLTAELTASYAATFNAEVVNVDFPYGDSKISLQYFVKPSAETKEKIVSICSSNGAEFVVAPVTQIITGGRKPPYERKTDIATNIAIFDRNGALIATGSTHTPDGAIRWQAQNHVEDLQSLFVTAGNNLQQLIGSLK
jgi:hypothetical protein